TYLKSGSNTGRSGISTKSKADENPCQHIPRSCSFKIEPEYLSGVKRLRLFMARAKGLKFGDWAKDCLEQIVRKFEEAVSKLPGSSQPQASQPPAMSPL